MQTDLENQSTQEELKVQKSFPKLSIDNKVSPELPHNAPPDLNTALMGLHEHLFLLKE